MNDSSYVFEIIHSTMQNSNNQFSVKELCSIAGVSRSGYYAWVKAAPIREQQELQDRTDFELILTAYKMHGYTKGARGIYMALLQESYYLQISLTCLITERLHTYQLFLMHSPRKSPVFQRNRQN